MRSFPCLVCVLIAVGLGCATELENQTEFRNPNGGSTAGGSGGGGSGGGGSGGGGVAGCAGAAGASGACVGGGGGGSPPIAACDAPNLVFNVPDTEGGCQGALCHMGTFPPELHTEGVAGRLKDVAAGLCTGQTYIDSANPANSFILNKVQQAMPVCGGQMPYMPNAALTAEKMECLVEWVNSVAAAP